MEATSKLMGSKIVPILSNLPPSSYLSSSKILPQPKCSELVYANHALLFDPNYDGPIKFREDNLKDVWILGTWLPCNSACPAFEKKATVNNNNNVNHRTMPLTLWQDEIHVAAGMHNIY